MDDGKVIKVTPITAEEAVAFYERVEKQNRRISEMIVIDTDLFIELVEREQEQG